MDFMLEEELIDLMTFCLQNPDSSEIPEKHARISEIGRELYDDGGVDALENFFFVLKNRKIIFFIGLVVFMLLPWNFSSNDVNVIELNQDNIGYYQENPCEISFFDFAFIVVIYYWIIGKYA